MKPSVARRVRLLAGGAVTLVGLLHLPFAAGESDFRGAARLLRESGWDTRAASARQPREADLLVLPPEPRRLLASSFRNGEASRFTNGYVEVADHFLTIADERRSIRNRGVLLACLGTFGIGLAVWMDRVAKRASDALAG